MASCAARGRCRAGYRSPHLLHRSKPFLPSHCAAFFEAVDKGEFQVVTSVVTLAEVLVHPMRQGDHDLAERYRRILLHANHVTTLPVWGSIAEDAAQLRARHGMRTPDAIQLATALSAGASSFLTNDSRFPSLASLKIIVLTNLAPKK